MTGNVKNHAINYAYYDSPLGLIEIGGTADGVSTLHFVEERRDGVASNPVVKEVIVEKAIVEKAIVEEAVRQVAEYFAGERRTFDLPLVFRGTDFQRRVWRQLLTIPYGQTTTYQAIAEALGTPQAVRAVGAANGQNPISLIVPCHRVIGRDGKLTGYGGGLWRKEWLLRHEGALLV